MPQFFKQLFGILFLVIGSTSCGCLTLSNSFNFKNAPRESFVKVEILTNEYASTGSGVIINHIDNSNTIILTAGHVCHTNTVAMRVIDLKDNKYPIIGFVTAIEDDLCLLITETIISAKPLRIAENNLEIGDHIYNLAAPLGIHGPDLTLMFDGYYEGHVKISEEKYNSDIYNLVGVGGSSGSPILNSNWEIVGIISRGVPEFQSVMISVTQERVKLFYDYSFGSSFKNTVIETRTK